MTMNIHYLTSYGFSDADIQWLTYILQIYGKITPSIVNQVLQNSEYAKRLIYANQFITGDLVFNYENDDFLKGHLKKINNHLPSIGVGDIPITDNSKFYRYGHIDGLQDSDVVDYPVMSLLNNSVYAAIVGEDKGKYILYLPPEVNLQIPYNFFRRNKMAQDQGFFVEEGNYIEGYARIITLNKEFVRVVPSYAIVASTKKPGDHLGSNEIITPCGGSVYVYAAPVNGSNLKLKFGNARVYFSHYAEELIQPYLQYFTEILVSPHVKGLRYTRKGATAFMGEGDDDD